MGISGKRHTLRHVQKRTDKLHVLFLPNDGGTTEAPEVCCDNTEPGAAVDVDKGCTDKSYQKIAKLVL